MTDTAKLFANGRSQAVRLPAAYRFEGKEVYIRRDPRTGEVILSAKPPTWDGFLDALQTGGAAPEGFLDKAQREQQHFRGDPLAEVSS